MTSKNFKKVYLVILFGILFLISGIPKSLAAEALTLPNPAATISMDFKDANLKDVLKVFSMQSGLNFVASEAVKDRTLTLYLDKVPVLDCLDKIFKANNLSYEKDPTSNIIIVKDWGKPQVQTITKVYPLRYNRLSTCRINQEISNYLDQTTTTTGTGLQAAVSGGGVGGGVGVGGAGLTITGDEGITQSIKKILTEYGKITEDIRSNSVIVTDIPSNFPVIEATIAALDVPQPMVLLEVEMLDVSKEQVDKIGMKYGTTPFTAVIKGTTYPTAWPFSTSTKAKLLDKAITEAGGISVNASDASAYTVQFDFLRKATDTKFLARPRILTLSNETAEIKIVTNEAIGVSSTTVATGTGIVTGTAERTETGIILRITPQVNPITAEITMFVMPVVAEASSVKSTFAAGAGSFEFTNPETRVTKSVIRVKDGDTIVIGGLIRNSRTQVVTKLPFFGDIPLLGALFRHKGVEPDRERELIVFITPRIVKESSKQLAQAQTVSPAASQPKGSRRQDLIEEALKKYHQE